ncbi:hypothetical protein GY15_27090 [Delftia sp. 670]|nr:hypothetical protein GY15_27090 [Delftia sp. 670]
MYLVFIPRDAAGVTVTDDWDGFGQRVTGSGSVQFDRVRVEPEWVVPFTSSFERPTTIGPFAQIIHAALDAGIGHGALQAALPFIREHARPWVDAGVASATQDPLLLQQLGNVHVRLRAADAWWPARPWPWTPPSVRPRTTAWPPPRWPWPRPRR